MATVGEVLYCGRETSGQLMTLRYFNGRPVVSLGGGYNKIFVVEDKGSVAALHPVENELDAFGEEQELSIEKQSLENLGEIKMIRCGRGHTLYLTQDGFVFASGKGAFGVLGLGGALNSPTPMAIKTLSDKTVVQVACGNEHSLALTDTGDVYSWGRGFEGQLGFNQATTVSSTPKYLYALRGKPVTKVACGHSHSMVLTRSGDLYSWGEGRCGQLGCGIQRLCFIPQLIVFKDAEGKALEEKVVDMSCGSGHSGAVTRAGDLYMWGLNTFGQLGIGDENSRFYPTPVYQDVVGIYLHDIKQLSCSDYSSFVIDSKGRLYSWGKGYIGHKDRTFEQLPRKVELNTEHRDFSQIYAAGGVFACFAPLHVYSISPFCGPVTGGTKLSLIGTAFAQSEQLKIRFKYEDNVIERPCEFDQETSSLVCYTPAFQDEGEELSLPSACGLEVTMDSEHYIQCDERFLIYDKDLQPTSLNPKCAAITGNTILQIDVNLDAFEQAWLWHLTVGFAVKPKAKNYPSPSLRRELTRTPSHDESRMSQASGRGEGGEVEWRLTAGKYEKGQVTCKVPSLTSYDENSMAYMVDIAPNGQQFTGKPLNFRYYDVSVSAVEPLSGSINAGTTITIHGKGLYDSSAKKLHLRTEESGEREVVLEWDRKNKAYIGIVPPLAWLFKGMEPDSYALKQIAKRPVEMQLTLNGIDFIPLPSFHYIDVTIVRLSKAKLDPTLSTERQQVVWLSEEPLPSPEVPEVKLKRETDEQTEMNVAIRPNQRLFIWLEDLVKSEGLTARFIVDGKAVDVKAVFKHSQKAGVIVPDLGDFQTPQEVRVELSMSGQSFSESGKVFKYLGASAPEEGVKRRGK